MSWALDPFARGGDAVLLPGHPRARAALMAVEGRLVLASEALSPTPQTVQGALASGARAARLCLDLCRTKL